jgi:hypothetical protein
MLIKLGRFRQKAGVVTFFSVTGGGVFFYIDLMWAKLFLALSPPTIGI